MPFHFSQFLSAGALNQQLQDQLRQLPHFPSELQHCLLAGPEHSGRTAMLFHYAYTCAAAGQDVVFVCRRKSVELEPPVLPVGVSKEDPVLGRIHMRFLNTLADVQQYAACMHLSEAPPTALIVDDLSQFDSSMPGNRRQHDGEVMSTFSYLHDATQWAGRHRADKWCALLISELSSMEGPRMQFLFQRWCPCILLIGGSPRDDAAHLQLAPTVFDHHDMATANHVALTFSISRHQALVLEDIKQL